MPAGRKNEADRRATFAFTVLVICLVLTTATAVTAQTGDAGAAAKPGYADLQSKPYEYHGLGRDIPEPEHVETIRIGLFVPSRGPRAADGLSLRRGAELAIAEANSQGGVKGIPLELMVRADDFTWGSAREVVKLVYQDHVWAVVGSIGGESTHVAQQIITKAQLPLIATASTDASLTQINIPWMFRLMPDDDAIARLLASHLVKQKNYDTIVAVASTSYDARLRAEAFEKHLNRLGRSVALSLRFNSGATDFTRQLALIARSGADAVVIWGDPDEAATLISSLTAVAVFAGPGLERAEFIRRSGPSAEGLTVVSLCDLERNDPALIAFKRAFMTTFHCEPNVIAAFAYDGVGLVINAIRRARLNRANIRDQLATTSEFHGVTGDIHFDGSGANTVLPLLKIVKDGQFRVIEGRQHGSIEVQRTNE